MRNKKLRVKINSIICATILLAIFFGYTNCGTPTSIFQKTQGTTGTGNPMAPTTNKILYAVCGILTRCHPELTFDECWSGALLADGVNAPLGLSSEYTTLSAILQGELTGMLISDSSSSNSCYSGINNLNCSDPQVVAAYQSATPHPFAGVATLIPGTSCAGALATPAQYVCSNKVFLRNAMNAENPVIAPVTGLNYSVSPALPPGLILDSHTGAISGTPTTITPLTVYTVTAAGASGAATSQIQIQTSDGFLVNDLKDTTDKNPGDGVCATNDGTCTLRAAIAEADANSQATPTTIVLSSGTVALENYLSLKSSLHIYGGCESGTTLDGQAKTHIFYVESDNINIAMDDIKLQNGLIASDGAGAGGAAVSSGYKTNVTFQGQRLKFYNNVSGSTNNGGGAIMWNDSFHCNDCIFNGNRATAGIGGAASLSGRNTFQNTVFVHNSATDGGGAVYSVNADTFTNCTFHGNSTLTRGGAVYLNASGSSFINSTVTENSDSGAFGTGGIASNSGVSATFANTLLYNNSGVRGNCFVNIISNGGNLSYPVSPYCTFSQATDISAAPVLGPLQNNGGFSETRALLPGSPGVRQGVAAQCPATDQRNFMRHVSSGTCDVGAYESQ